MRPEFIGKPDQDINDLPTFGIFQFTDLVVQVENFSRLDKYSLTGGRFVMNEAFQLPFTGSQHRYDHAAIPYRYFGIFRSKPVLAGILHALTDPAVNRKLFAVQLIPDLF